MTHTLGGKPITGTISYYADKPKDQRPPEEFVAAVDAVLAFPEVEAVRWRQYTPYFNDGDACVFDPCSPDLRIAGADDEDGWTEEVYVTYPDGYWDTHYNSQWPHSKPSGSRTLPSNPADENVVKYYGAPEGWESTPELDAAVAALVHALEDGHHNVMLHEVFGDPAEVVATADGYHVEEYDHD